MSIQDVESLRASREYLLKKQKREGRLSPKLRDRLNAVEVMLEELGDADKKRVGVKPVLQKKKVKAKPGFTSSIRSAVESLSGAFTEIQGYAQKHGNSDPLGVGKPRGKTGGCGFSVDDVLK